MRDAQFILLWVYVVAGPVAWLTMFVLLMLGRRRMSRLVRFKGRLPDDPPSVTVMVPAKDEADGMAGCIEHIQQQDYPNFDIIAINDRSTDRTGQILDELAARHPNRLKVIHIPVGGLPEGWLGKCHALHVGTRQARGQWLLLVDSDVKLQPDAISRAIGLSAGRRYDALSILTRLDCRSFWEGLVLPLVGSAWAVMNVVSLTNDDSRPHIAVANGQFILVRRSAYEAVGGHEAIRSEITEDVELMRLLKGRGFRVRFMMGAHLASTRMHSSLKQMFHGWGRIFGGTSRRKPGRIIGAMLFVLICGFSVYPAMAWGIMSAARWGDWSWLGVSGMHLCLMTTYLALMYRWSGNRARYAWLFPLGGTMLLGILGFALQTCRTGRVFWRDTHFEMPARDAGLKSGS